jgi:hypothetical protein
MCHRVVGVVIVIFFIIVGVSRSEFIPRLVLVWQTSRLGSRARACIPVVQLLIDIIQLNAAYFIPRIVHKY